MRISDWSSDVCSSDLQDIARRVYGPEERPFRIRQRRAFKAEEQRSHQGAITVQLSPETFSRPHRLSADALDAMPVARSRSSVFSPCPTGSKIGRASCRALVCPYV